jgi:hypothetical protein
MKLYHGTSKKHLFNILQDGITPRLLNGVSNWDKAPSNPNMVYLTVAYPFRYSIEASGDDRIGAVVEIDADELDSNLFLPDEDYISQSNAAYNASKGSKEAVTDIRQIRDNLFAFQGCWEDSLRELGNCCYFGTIPPRAITRYCTVDWGKRPDLEWNYTDHDLSILHYSFRGGYYSDVVRWFFGDAELLPENIGEISDEGLDDKEHPEIAPLIEMIQKLKQATARASANRKGIKVVNVQHLVGSTSRGTEV